MTDDALHRVDVLLTEMVELVETARALPMSSSCVVPREHMLDLLDGLRDVLPAEMDEARRLAAQRDTLIGEVNVQVERIRDEATRAADREVAAAREQAAAIRAEADQYLRDAQATARVEAQRLIEEGRAQHLRLVSATGVHQAAVSIAERVRQEADQYAAGVQAGADRYADATQSEAERAAAALRQDADRYAERTLGDLVEVLGRALATTERGREELCVAMPMRRAPRNAGTRIAGAGRTGRPRRTEPRFRLAASAGLTWTTAFNHEGRFTPARDHDTEQEAAQSARPVRSRHPGTRTASRLDANCSA